MSNVTISTMAAATAPLAGTELMECSQLSGTVKIVATTLSALASDQSYNDSALGFGAAGFSVGDRVNVVGFSTSGGVNNLLTCQITALTNGKMTTDQTAILVNESAGSSITITKWTTKRTNVKDVGAGSNTAYVSKTSVSSASHVLTLDLAQNSTYETTLTENITTLTINNILASPKANFFTLKMKQDGTGGWTFAYPSSFKFPGAVAYVMSAAAGAVDILQGITYDGGTTWYITYAQAFG